jgi:hypothetical protein
MAYILKGDFFYCYCALTFCSLIYGALSKFVGVWREWSIHPTMNLLSDL